MGGICLCLKKLRTTRPLAFASKQSTRKSSSKSGATVPTSSSSWDNLKSAWEENSGQAELSQLKDAVSECSARFDDSVQKVTDLRRSVEETQKVHDDAQRRYSTLLMKRDQWDVNEAASFVDVTAQEVQARQKLQSIREALRQAEIDASQCQRKYMDSMRQRYHEEQLWQDKWRVFGTYGTWSLIGLNSIIFLGGQYLHNRRERMRLEALEEMIVGKLVGFGAFSKNEQHIHNMQDQENIGSSDEIENINDSNKNNMITKDQQEKANILVEKFIESDDANMMSKNNKKKGENHPNNWKMSFIKGKIIHHEALRSIFVTLHKIAEHEYSKISNELHGPSVAVGVAGATLGFFVLTLITNRR